MLDVLFKYIPVFLDRIVFLFFSYTVHPPESVGSQNVCQMFTFLGLRCLYLGTDKHRLIGWPGLLTLEQAAVTQREEKRAKKMFVFSVPPERGPAVRPAGPAQTLPFRPSL